MTETRREYQKRHGYSFQKRYHLTAKGMASALVSKARDRARRYGFAFNLDTDHVHLLLEAALILGTVTTEKKQPHTASLDKIEPALGYVMGNVQIVPQWYNLAKHDFTSVQIDAAIAAWVSSHGN